MPHGRLLPGPILRIGWRCSTCLLPGGLFLFRLFLFRLLLSLVLLIIALFALFRQGLLGLFQFSGRLLLRGVGLFEIITAQSLFGSCLLVTGALQVLGALPGLVFGRRR